MTSKKSARASKEAFLSWTKSKRVIARCVHCGRFFRERDHYMVRNAVWAAAGMDSYQAGYLHIRCLEERLGRKLTGADVLVRCTKAGIEMHPDYPNSPERALGESGLDGATTVMKMLWRIFVDSGKLTAREAEEYGLDVDARYAYVPQRDSDCGWVLVHYQWRFEQVDGVESLVLGVPNDTTEVSAWLELPQEVRNRVVARMKHLYPEKESEDEYQEIKRDLQSLAVKRLVEHCKGDIKQAIKTAKKIESGRLLLQSVGEREKDWENAIAYCEGRLREMVNGKTWRKRGLTVQRLVAQELGTYRNRN